MLDQLQQNIVQLISKYETLKEENRSLTSKLEEVREELSKATEEISTLKQTNENLKLKSAFVQSESTVEAKEKIDRLIHQIDKCIEMIG